MLAIINEGWNIFSRNIRVKIHGLKRYPGNDDHICIQIIEDCYNDDLKRFSTSNGNYKVFYSRDFGWCIQALLRLNYEDKVRSTLEYAMERYSSNNGITVAINKHGKCFNFPDTYSPDSVAYMFRSLRIAKSKSLIIRHRKFLNSEISRFEKNVLDKDGMIKDRNFSGMRDHNTNTKLCYDMTIACMLSDEITKINKMFAGKNILDNKLIKYNLKNKLVKNYWNGKFFNDSIDDKYCSGHANVYPYFLGVISEGNNKMLRFSIKSIMLSGLDKPFPLKYGFDKNTRFIWYSMFASGWEKHTTWAMLGLAYIDILSRIDRSLAKKYLLQYKKNILKYRCFIELYDKGKPYSSLFFSADDSMLWSSMYLDLKYRLKIK